MHHPKSIVTKNGDFSSQEATVAIDERIFSFVRSRKAKFLTVCKKIAKDLKIDEFFVKERIWFHLSDGKLDISNDRVFIFLRKAA